MTVFNDKNAKLGNVAVVNRTNFKNFGSVLQCYALCEAISSLGYDSEILWEKGSISKRFDVRPRKLLTILFKLATRPVLLRRFLKSFRSGPKEPITPETSALFESFVKRCVRLRLATYKELVELARSPEYVKIVCGSDQVWCSAKLFVDPMMYLRFVPREKRVAYAPSIGRRYIPSYNRRVMKKYVNDVPCVSIREDVGQKLIKELTGRDVPVVADPTLLLGVGHWRALEADFNVGSRYALCYFLDEPQPQVQQKIEAFAAANSLRIVALGAKLRHISEKTQVEYPDCGPSEFLRWVSGTEISITDSYHGALFSISYGKRFYSVEREYGDASLDQSSRQLSILNTLQLLDRYVKPTDDFEFALDEIDYGRVGAALSAFRAESLEYLRNALASSPASDR